MEIIIFLHIINEEGIIDKVCGRKLFLLIGV